jgi:hypothetical protein
MTKEELSSLLERSMNEWDKDNSNDTSIPLRSDGSEYRIDDLEIDQKKALAEVLSAIKEYCTNPEKMRKNVLRMTVSGVAGSGKSTWINTLVTCVLKMFDDKDTIAVFAPTGSAAYNAGGETLHRGFRLPLKIENLLIGSKKQEYLLCRFGRTLVIIIDERSMVDATTLGMIKEYMQKCAHSGLRPDDPWGGIPIIILVGDDYQLPSIDYGAIYSLPAVVLVKDSKFTSSAHKKVRQDGFDEFMAIGRKVMFLDGEKRVNGGQDQFKAILRGVRCEEDENGNIDELSEGNIQRLLALDLNHKSFSLAQRKAIEAEATYIYANKKPRDIKNATRLKEANSSSNPVAKIKSRTVNAYGKKVGNMQHYDNDRYPNQVLICKSAKVSLSGFNPNPAMGLYHGSLGVVRDIVFWEGESPNTDDHPCYVLVDFHHYCGPELIESMPTTVPIVAQTQRCNLKCCTRPYFPLVLAYGKTAHTFQGQTVGPVPEGRPKNAISKIIIDPGTRQFEGLNVGLFYTLLGRGTTLGEESEKLSSSIYFDGPNFCRQRMVNLTIGGNNNMYRKAALRRDWVTYLKGNSDSGTRWTEEALVEIFEWASTTRISNKMLKELVSK